MINLNDLKKPDSVVLTPLEGSTMATCWITVGNVSLQLVRAEHSLCVNAYATRQEMDDPLSYMDVSFSEAQLRIDRSKLERGEA